MRPSTRSTARALTILTFLGLVLSIQPHHLVNLQKKALIPRQSETSFATTLSSSRTSSSSTSPTTSTTSSSTSTTTEIPSTTTTTSSSSLSTSTSTASSTPPPETTSSTTSRFSTSSRSSSSTSFTSTTSSTSSTLAISDLTNTALSLPTSFTSTYASTGSDGDFHTVTAVVSRPTGASAADGSATRKGFFANTGAVAGTFLVVGLIGTGVLLCGILWGIRRYRRRRNDHAYFDDEYKEFGRQGDHNGGTTPDPAFSGSTRDSAFTTPVPPSPAPNMIEHLHGGNAQSMPSAGAVHYDGEQGQHQGQPDEFDPYQTHGQAYAYSDDHGNYAQYPDYAQYAEQGIAYAYELQATDSAQRPPGAGPAGPSHAAQDSLDSFYQVDPNFRGPRAH